MNLDRRLMIAGGVGALGATFLTTHAANAENGAACTRQGVFNALAASGPRIVPGEDAGARLFDRLAGTWNVEYCTVHDDNSRENTRGQLIAGWVLDGRALQDVWIEYPSSGTDRFMGTTLRFYDEKRKTWRITWVSPIAQAVTLLEGGDEAGRIVLYGEGPRGRLRWTFSDITDKAFVWRGELSTDRGATWRLREDHRMHRASRSL